MRCMSLLQVDSQALDGHPTPLGNIQGWDTMWSDPYPVRVVT
jgi:hypothetical protein